MYQSQKCLETCFEEKNIASALLGNVMKHKAKRIEIQDHMYAFKVTLKRSTKLYFHDVAHTYTLTAWTMKNRINFLRKCR